MLSLTAVNIWFGTNYKWQHKQKVYLITGIDLIVIDSQWITGLEPVIKDCMNMNRSHVIIDCSE